MMKLFVIAALIGVSLARKFHFMSTGGRACKWFSSAGEELVEQ
jgi:hypothetical protein